MTKEELKKLLKEHLEIDIQTVLEFGPVEWLEVTISFDGEEICSCSERLPERD